MKKLRKIVYTLLGLLLVSVIALVGMILYAEYSGSRFLPGKDKGGSTAAVLSDDESRLVYDENGNIAELPGIVPDTGDSTQDGENNAEDAETGDSATHTFIMDKASSLFHYEACPDVPDISEENRLSMTGTREEVESRGYEPCKSCSP